MHVDETDLSILIQIEKRMRRYSLSSKLEMFRKLNHTFDPRLRNETFWINMFPNNTPIELNCNIHELAYLSLISVISGEWSGHIKEFTKYEDLKREIRSYREYRIPFIHQNDKGADISLHLFIVRSALQQFIYQKNPISGIYHYSYLFNYENSKISVIKAFKEIFKYDFEDYLFFVTFVYNLSNSTLNKLTIDKIKNELSKNNRFTLDKIEFMVSVLSMSRDTAIKLYNEFKSKDDRMKIYNLNPFLLNPFLIEGNNLYLPNPTLLFRAITEGFYHRICSLGLGFRADIGKYAYEDLIENLFSDVNYKVIKEFTFNTKKGEGRTCDFMLVCNNDLILVEVKATTPSVALRDSDIHTYRKELHKAYVKAIIQCHKKEDLIETGYINHPDLPKYESINRISYLVITLEEFYMIDHDLIEKMLLEEGVSKKRHYHTMGTLTLEKVLDNDKRNLFDFIHQREDNNTVYSRFPDTEIDKLKNSKSKSFIYFSNVINDFTNK